MKVLAFAASARTESVNQKLIRIAVEIAREGGMEVDLVDYRDFDMPLYDGDLEVESGVPDGAIEFKRRLESADGLMISLPEYNHSIPGTLKNTIDWVSRFKPSPFSGRPGFLMSASPSPFGGIRALWVTRASLESLGMIIRPEMFSLMKAPDAFDDQGRLIDPMNAQVLEGLIEAFINLTQSLKSI
jgi:NAD(P)H-dependent FMN reductase